MSEKTLKTRIIHKHDKEDNWLKATSFIPKQGELIIYDIDDAHQYERFKIGDGVKNVNNLPFATDDKVDKIDGKGLSKNDLTDALKISYDSAVNAKHTHDNKSVLDATTASYTTDEKSKLSKIAPGANNYTLPVAGSALGGIKSGTDITVDANGNVSVNDDSHNHIISNVDGLQNALNAKVPTSRKVNGKALSSDITLSAGDVGADASGSAANALTSAKAYTDTAVANLVDSAPEALNTLGELATALSEHEDAYDALLETVGGKVNKENGKGLSTNDLTDGLKANYNAAYTHSGTAHAPSNAEKNQNAFSNVVVGSTTIAADTATDSLTLVGSNVTLTPDATNDKITIGITKANVTDALGYTPPSTDTKYAHPTYTAKSSGLYKVTVDSTGHVSAATTVTKSDITALGIPGSDTNTTYNNATTSTAGLMSAADKSKLDGITSSADSVSFTRSLTTGSKIGTITINGEGTDLYAPVPQSVTIDDAISSTSTNPLQNKAVYNELTKCATAISIRSNGIIDVHRYDTIGTATYTVYTLPTASSTTKGGVTTTSTVTSTTGLTACPIIDGVPYYKSVLNFTYNSSTKTLTIS